MASNVLNKLESFMLTPKNLVQYTRSKLKVKYTDKDKDVKKRVIRYNKNYFVPAHSDKLFWIFFIMKYGFEEYELLGSNIFEKEKSHKIELIQHLKAKNKMLRDTYKFKRLDICESDLLNEEKITFKTFHALCMIHSLNILYINNRTYCKLLCDNDEDDIDSLNIIHKVGDDYMFEYMPRIEVTTNYIHSKYEIENYEKPIKSIGSYKLNDLKNMAISMKFPNNVLEMKKAEIYEKICEYLNIEI